LPPTAKARFSTFWVHLSQILSQKFCTCHKNRKSGIMKSTYRFTLRTAPNKKGLHQIQIDCNLAGIRVRIGTEVYVPKPLFSPGLQKCQHQPGYQKKEVQAINQQLADWHARLTTTFRTAEERGLILTKTTFTTILQGTQHADFLTFAHATIKRKLALQEITTTTEHTYRQAINHLIALYGPIISFHQLADMPRQFEAHLKNSNLSANTRKKHHTRLKALLNEAYSQGLTALQPYHKYKIGTIKGNRISLTEAELRQLFTTYREATLPAHLQNTLQYFLFACITGLRHSDLAELTHRNIQGSNIIFTPIKTKRLEKQIEMRLPAPAAELITTTTGKLFHVISNQKSNQNLKQITQHLSIGKKVTMHVARHTFGTLFIHLGGDIASLQALMGHSKIETTSQYLHLAESLKRQQATYFDGM
jgi:site-specific recombinase XerD